MMIASIAPLFSHYLQYYRYYILSHYMLSLYLQLFCQTSGHSFTRRTSPLETTLLVFAWFSTLRGEVVTNLISSLICCREFTTHHFLMMDGEEMKHGGLRRESLMWQGSTIWLMDFTVTHPDMHHLRTVRAQHSLAGLHFVVNPFVFLESSHN